ncbi:diacylglycerol kinase family protein [Micromonospora auratinigra]|uniref:Diacylglycerol kinase catalytic domain-containing protein n=1 Tax=Micromonospora auratinigra TaxID=261654 RepID=A0A1A9A264_9ACTN|nr:diacylglycerol kinase family protein [Micromonospora auratinigra]SBT50252.1 Diacylglycerol kinase catalytic domain-containing protein [Micromonospora auratinigra]
MYDVVLLTLGSGRDGSGGGCGSGGACCGGAAEQAGEPAEERCETPRVPVLACADALTARGARVETVTARSDAEIDEVLARLDGPPRPDGLTWPDPDGKTRLVVATASDGQLRAVLRRLVRRYAPPPSRRPADLAGNRTVPDLPPVGVLPLDPARTGTARDLAAQLGLPRDPAAVAAAVLDGTPRRLDLLRNDGGSVTLDGVLLGAADDEGRPLHWRARVEVDDAVLSQGEDPIMVCAIGNAGGYARLDDVTLLADPDPADGRVEVAVAVPVVTRSALGRKKVRIEVRRARGRAVAVVPRDEQVPFLDDGVEGELGRKRSWWTEPGAWAVWTS